MKYSINWVCPLCDKQHHGVASDKAAMLEVLAHVIERGFRAVTVIEAPLETELNLDIAEALARNQGEML